MEQAKENWKEHPVVIAALAAAGGIGFAIGVYQAVVLPTFVKDKEMQITELNKRIEDLNKRTEALEKAGKEVTEHVATLTGELKGAKQRNLELSRENIFSTEDVYPKGFRKVRLGEPTSKIVDVYPKTM
jgi:septal ring factor EnvC (AmiA/AmiB activator)